MSLDFPLSEANTDSLPSRVGRLVLPVFAVTIFLSAFLLFSVQPMFTKMVLPRLGGTPAVWSVAMVFFQGLLLLGYLYAHLSAKHLSTRTAASIHVALLATTFLIALPIGVSNLLGRPTAGHEAFWLLGVFSLSVGLPFFAVAGNGPLLQSWFARSGHKQAGDPYFLYGASNLGSFAALLLYPTLIEPFLTLYGQSLMWAVGFVVLGCGIALSATCVFNTGKAVLNPKTAPIVLPISWRQRLAWVFLSLVPSGLLVAVTAHISTDIASAPFLWVVPLALFLLTFVLVFRERPLLPHRLMDTIYPAAAVTLCISYYWLPGGGIFGLALHLGALFVAVMICHGQLYKSRPAAAQLTEFYFWMSCGGVLGGLFASLVSPLIFNSIYEYPILIVLALCCLPGDAPIRWRRRLIEFACVVLIALVFGLVWNATGDHTPLQKQIVLASVGALGASIIWLERRKALVSAIGAAGLFLSLGAIADSSTEVSVRSFFGVNRLMLRDEGQYRDIVHGNTIHGTVQIRNADASPVTGKPQPLAYYSFGGAIDQAINAARATHRGKLAQVAVAGLGAGSLACHVRPGEDWTFMEIDPSVIQLARDRRWFRFLSDCAADAKIFLGDARLVLADQPTRYDAIVLDAFSSDSIPVHLLTAEAFAMYLTKLTPDGAIILNTSNRYLDIAGQVAALAERFGLRGAILAGPDSIRLAKSLPKGSSAAEVVLLSRDPATIEELLKKPYWHQLPPADTTAWTDDFSNILGAMLRKK